MMLVEEKSMTITTLIGLWRFLPIYASQPLRHSEEPAKGENRGSIKVRNHAKAVSIY